jgi:hypothetical protein
MEDRITRLEYKDVIEKSDDDKEKNEKVQMKYARTL